MRDIHTFFQASILQANNLRKQDAIKRIDFYHDDQLPHLEELLARQFTYPDKLQPAFVNIVKKIIDLLAMTYFKDARRDVEGTDQDKQLLEEIVLSSNLDVKMKLASRYVKLLKTVMIRPVWRFGRMDLDVITPDLLDVQVGSTPEEIENVMVTHYGSSTRIEDTTFSVWTPEEFKKLDHRGRVLFEEPNPYGVIPFVALWDRVPTSDFWLPGGADLISIQETINARLTDLIHTIRFQAFGVGWIRGGGGEALEGIDPGSLVELPENGELGYAATQAKIEETVNAIDQLMKWVAVSNGIPASSLSTEPTEESGVSKLVSNRELDEKRRDDVSLFRTYEQRLFDLFRIVWNVHNRHRKFSESCEFKIDFADPQPVPSEAEKVEIWSNLLDLKVITPVDIVMERNPDLKTREDALAYLMQLQQERDETI